ncbi:MAG TPA: PAS domain S-box protein, partial [Eubacteriaceae bacterium]|nr:PAS domain S-box protein [Eubacteriaceae bacterium]
MSEHINNREHRQKLLKELILELHEGKDFDEVKQKFEENFKDVSATEITEMETQLVKDGLPVEEIQKLCDVHASVFKGTIDQIHRTVRDEDTPGHPVHTFRLENKAIEKLIEDRIKPHIEE